MENHKRINQLFEEMDYPAILSKIDEYIKSSIGDKKVLIGLSGGIDSSLSCSLAVHALGKERVGVLTVKNIRYSDENLAIARNYAKKLGLGMTEVDSNGIREQFLSRIEFANDDVRGQSTLDARITDLLIRTFSSKQKRIYLGTINGTERLTGWYPKGSLFGDFCPIGGLLKHQVQGLAKYLGLSETLINSVSADASSVCSGCGQLPEFKGMPYSTLDTILYFYETVLPEEIPKLLEENNISKEYWDLVIDRVKSVAHKGDLFPDYCKINF